MSLEAAREFRSKVNSSGELQSALSAFRKVEQTIDLAKQHGYSFTAQEIVAIADEATQSEELSDFELELVSGGTPICCVNCDGGGPS